MLFEAINRQPILQLALLVVCGLSLFAIYPLLIELPNPQMAIGFAFVKELETENWFKLSLASVNLLLLTLTFFRNGSLLRSFKFSNDSRFELFFLMILALLLEPSLLMRTDLVIVLFLLQLSMEFQLQVHTQLKVNGLLGAIAFFLSIGSFFHPFAFVLSLVVYLGVLFQRGFHLREFFIYWIVFALPYYFLLATFYLLDLNFYYFLGFDQLNLIDLSLSTSAIGLGLFLAFFIILLLRSLALNAKETLRMKAQFRNYYLIFISAILWALLVDHQEGFVFLLLPAAAIFSQAYATLKAKKWFDLFLLLFLLFCLSTQFLINYHLV